MAARTVSFPQRAIGLLLLVLQLSPRVTARYYSSQWAAHIEGGPEVAKNTAEQHGFVLLGEVMIFFSPCDCNICK